MNAKPEKSLRYASSWGTAVPGMTARLFALFFSCALLGCMFVSLQALPYYALCLILSVAIAVGMLAAHYMEGMARGEEDAKASRQAQRLLDGGHALDKKLEAHCYHPLKAICAAAICYAVPLVCGVLTALHAGEAGEAVYWPRVIARVCEMIFINYFPEPKQAGTLIDCLTPLLIASFPLAYLAGYLAGPGREEKREAQMRRAKKIAKKRAERSTMAASLLRGEGSEAPQRGERARKGKKELI